MNFLWHAAVLGKQLAKSEQPLHVVSDKREVCNRRLAADKPVTEYY